MKILTVFGYTEEQRRNQQSPYPLVRLWLTNKGDILKVVVEPTSKEVQVFATEIEKRIKERLDDYPHEPFAYLSSDPKVHGLQTAKLSDAHVLEAIGGDVFLWGGIRGMGIGDIEGYDVVRFLSKIEDVV